MFKRPGDFRVSLGGGSPRHDDLALLDRLSGEHGADLRRPRAVRLFMSFPSEGLAFEAGRLLHAAGFDVSGLEPSEPDAPWGVRATGRLQLDRVNVADFRARFEGIAGAQGGELDHWEAAAQP